MKFAIHRDHFSSGLQQVQSVVGTRATMPILSNVLIEAREGEISLTTTNLDMGIRCTIQAEVEEPGGLTLPVRKLATIVKELPNLDVEVSAAQGTHQAKITSGGSLFRIMGISPEEFPPLPTFDDEHAYTLPQDELARMLRSVSYAQSTDETRYIMNGVFFHFEEERLTLAATDGRRLAVVAQDLQEKGENAGHLILPAKTAAEVERLLGAGEGVRIAFNDRQVAFDIDTGEDSASGLKGAVHLVSKVVEGNYPDYKKVIPKETEQRIKVERELLLESVSRAALVTSDKNNSVKLKMHDNLLEITGSSPEYGESHESLAVNYDGPEVQVAFNPEFLKQPLSRLGQDEVFFEFKDELSPGVFKTMDSFLCVIMPLRLS